MKKIITIAALSAVLSTSAFAAGNNVYITADLSAASYSNATDGQTTFKNPGKFGIGAGYNFTQNVAAEVGYHSFSQSDIVYTNGTNSAKASSFTVAAVGNYPINPQFSAIGKLGFASNKMDFTTTVPGLIGSSHSKTALYFAVGGQYNINQQFAVRAQYENFGNMTNSSTVTNVSASAFGIAGVLNF